MTGQVAPLLKDYVDRGLVRVLDMLFLKEDADLGEGELGEFRSYESELAMLLSEDDAASTWSRWRRLHGDLRL